MTRAASRLAFAQRVTLTVALSVAAAVAPAHAREASAGKGFQFAVIGHPFKSGADEAPLKRAIAAAMQASPAFIVATGIKGDKEPCSDRLYAARHAILDDAAAPVVVSLAGSDWSALSLIHI